MKKPEGWRKEPARHALAAKGVETKPKNVAPTAGRSTPRPLTGTKPTEEAKESAVEKVLAAALAEAGDPKGAVELLENNQWLDRTAQKVVDSQTSDAKERATLKAEIVHAIHKNPTMEV